MQEKWYNLVFTSIAEDEGRSSHLLFTLHVYQYRIEKENKAGLPGGNISDYHIYKAAKQHCSR